MRLDHFDNIEFLHPISLPLPDIIIDFSSDKRNYMELCWPSPDFVLFFLSS